MDPDKYGNWINKAEPNTTILNNQRAHSFQNNPKIVLLFLLGIPTLKCLKRL